MIYTALILPLLQGRTSLADSIDQAAITLIIDDVGNNLHSGRRAIALPGPVTYAILPNSPYSEQLAREAHRNRKEVMLHMPMDNISNRALGPSALTERMDYVRFKNTLEQAIRSIPYLKGINNHMGSRLTQRREAMNWVMETLDRHSLYFVDSRTSHASIAAQVAGEKQIPHLARDVFLDHDPRPQAIDLQFKRLIRLARRQGSAVAIGHPYPSTLGYLENVIPKLDAMGIRLVSPNGLLILRHTASQKSQQPTGKPRMFTAMTDRRSDPTQCEITEQLTQRLVTCS